MKNLSLIVLIILLNACNGATLQVSKVAKGDAGLELKNGVLFYNNTPFDGILLEFDQINGTNNESNYVDGKKEGVERKIYTNNILAEERMYDKGLKIGIHKGWYKDGSVKFEYHYGNGMYDGSFKEWYQNGIPLKDFNYKKGKEYGSQKMWLSNGKIRANYVVKNGERFGLIGLKKCYSVTKK